MKLCSWFRRAKSDPIRGEVYKSVDGKFYMRFRRFGTVVFNGPEGFANRQQAEEELAVIIKSIKTGNYTTASLKS